MAKPFVTGMRSDKLTAASPLPQTRSELQSWVRDRLTLTPALEESLLMAIDAVFSRHERLWQESKQDAITALSAGFADKLSHAQTELSAKDSTVSSISRYFEALVADLTDKSHQDPKTKLMNFGRFTEQLESFLALEQRGRWCAVGLVDITGFKWYNDALGHAVGDRIIERVAMLLREQVRSDDLLAQERLGPRSEDLHARFGGDEFCFLSPDLAACHLAHAQGVRQPPRDLLRSIPGVEILPFAEQEICCGSAGIYNLVEPDAARELGDRKAGHIDAVNPDVIATANPGCTLQMRAAAARLGLGAGSWELGAGSYGLSTPD